MIKRILSKIIERFLPKNLPSFLVIGAQKCGTTSLHYYLEQHPKLVGSTFKELHFFNKDMRLGKGVDEYSKCFRGYRKEGVQFFESTPAYLYHPHVANAIKSHLPDARLIVVLRDPVKRACSAWNHYRQLFELDKDKKKFENKPRLNGNLLYESYFKGRDVFPSFQECINIELELIKQGNGFEPALLRRGLYLDQLEVYWKYFDRDKILIIGFEDFISDIKGTLSRVEDFLGVKKHHWENLQFEPRNKRVYGEKIKKSDLVFLEDFYSQANERLFKEIGELNW